MNDALKLGGNGEPAPVVKSEVVSEVALTLRQLLTLFVESENGKLLPQPPVEIEVKPVFRNGDFNGVKFIWRVPSPEPPAGTTILVNGDRKTVTAAELT